MGSHFHILKVITWQMYEDFCSTVKRLKNLHQILERKNTCTIEIPTLQIAIFRLHLKKTCRKNMNYVKLRRLFHVAMRGGNCAEFSSALSLIKHRLFAARNSCQKLKPCLKFSKSSQQLKKFDSRYGAYTVMKKATPKWCKHISNTYH